MNKIFGKVLLRYSLILDSIPKSTTMIFCTGCKSTLSYKEHRNKPKKGEYSLLQTVKILYLFIIGKN